MQQTKAHGLVRDLGKDHENQRFWERQRKRGQRGKCGERHYAGERATPARATTADHAQVKAPDEDSDDDLLAILFSA